MPAEPHLELRDLSKRYGDFVALKNVSLTIDVGEFVTFLGPSGCGKTTLLRAIAGLTPQTSGIVRISGRDVSHQPPAKRDFGIVFQSYALFPNLAVAENVAYGLGRASRDEKQRRVRELLAVVGLPDLGQRYPRELSGGQQQRVALARALAPRPGLLLLDEPLSALDAQVREELRQELKRIQRELQVTTIMVTHDQEEALTTSDRIVVMNHGVIEQTAPPDEIYNHPATPFVAQFVGRMNFLPARTSGTDGLTIAGLAHQLSAPHGFADDVEVKAAIRPERIRRTGASPISGPVTAVDFLGSRVRVAVAVPDWPQPVIAEFDAEVGTPTRPGDVLALELPPDALVAFERAG